MKLGIWFDFVSMSTIFYLLRSPIIIIIIKNVLGLGDTNKKMINVSSAESPSEMPLFKGI